MVKIKNVNNILKNIGYKIPNIDTVIQTLVSKYPQIKSIAQNINPKVTNVIFGDETKILYGENI